ncbi:Regulatory protein SIR4 [Nakaseomyces glabratus]|uniref:Sir4 n=1 Tax=Candida glabrata TaxID=5478 RepID=A0A0W0CRI6_CANGB|nr:Sir4 [Nakaseomyces glabratus]KAH7583397.1 Sir4 SID domain [Nakaseomyces glabratus]KAH7596421.1 Sir4 SID domain [Nakaseomyces glabratus]KAH7611988.1 Sir4 SID domain [Nakaseomyces glabratus]KTB02130.1 Regulatory protein SIR4 [Nakaseomyces glabratus]
MAQELPQDQISQPAPNYSSTIESSHVTTNRTYEGQQYVVNSMNGPTNSELVSPMNKTINLANQNLENGRTENIVYHNYPDTNGDPRVQKSVYPSNRIYVNNNGRYIPAGEVYYGTDRSFPSYSHPRNRKPPLIPLVRYTKSACNTPKRQLEQDTTIVTNGYVSPFESRLAYQKNGDSNFQNQLAAVPVREQNYGSNIQTYRDAHFRKQGNTRLLSLLRSKVSSNSNYMNNSDQIPVQYQQTNQRINGVPSYGAYNIVNSYGHVMSAPQRQRRSDSTPQLLPITHPRHNEEIMPIHTRNSIPNTINDAHHLNSETNSHNVQILGYVAGNEIVPQLTSNTSSPILEHPEDISRSNTISISSYPRQDAIYHEQGNTRTGGSFLTDVKQLLVQRSQSSSKSGSPRSPNHKTPSTTTSHPVRDTKSELNDRLITINNTTQDRADYEKLNKDSGIFIAKTPQTNQSDDESRLSGTNNEIEKVSLGSAQVKRVASSHYKRSLSADGCMEGPHALRDGIILSGSRQAPKISDDTGVKTKQTEKYNVIKQSTPRYPASTLDDKTKEIENKSNVPETKDLKSITSSDNSDTEYPIAHNKSKEISSQSITKDPEGLLDQQSLHEDYGEENPLPKITEPSRPVNDSSTVDKRVENKNENATQEDKTVVDNLIFKKQSHIQANDADNMKDKEVGYQDIDHRSHLAATEDKSKSTDESSFKHSKRPLPESVVDDYLDHDDSSQPLHKKSKDAGYGTEKEFQNEPHTAKDVEQISMSPKTKEVPEINSNSNNYTDSSSNETKNLTTPITTIDSKPPEKNPEGTNVMGDDDLATKILNGFNQKALLDSSDERSKSNSSGVEHNEVPIALIREENIPFSTNVATHKKNRLRKNSLSKSSDDPIVPDIGREANRRSVSRLLKPLSGVLIEDNHYSTKNDNDQSDDNYGKMQMIYLSDEDSDIELSSDNNSVDSDRIPSYLRNYIGSSSTEVTTSSLSESAQAFNFESEKRRIDRFLNIEVNEYLGTRNAYSRSSILEIIKKAVPQYLPLEAGVDVSVTNDICSVDNYLSSSAHLYQQLHKRDKMVTDRSDYSFLKNTHFSESPAYYAEVDNQEEGNDITSSKKGSNSDGVRTSKHKWRSQWLNHLRSAYVYFFADPESLLFDPEITTIIHVFVNEFKVNVAKVFSNDVDIIIKIEGNNSNNQLWKNLERKLVNIPKNIRVWDVPKALNFIKNMDIQADEWPLISSVMIDDKSTEDVSSSNAYRKNSGNSLNSDHIRDNKQPVSRSDMSKSSDFRGQSPPRITHIESELDSPRYDIKIATNPIELESIPNIPLLVTKEIMTTNDTHMSNVGTKSSQSPSALTSNEETSSASKTENPDKHEIIDSKTSPESADNDYKMPHTAGYANSDSVYRIIIKELTDNLIQNETKSISLKTRLRSKEEELSNLAKKYRELEAKYLKLQKESNED